MKKLIFIALTLVFFSSSFSYSQIWFEGFEDSDTANLPEGWTKWNNSENNILDNWNWTVRDSGNIVPGVNEIRRSKAHSGVKSVGVVWYCGLDTSGGGSNIADAWLVTKRIQNVPADCFVTYYATGGTPGLLDSLQIWISTGDSTPTSFLSDPDNYVETIVFLPNPVYGQFTEQFIFLGHLAGQTVWVGFRYYMNVQIDGVFVQLDDVTVHGTIGISQINTNIPERFALSQNYPNPFNPSTKIKFDIAKATNVKLTVYNSLGQVVRVLHEGQMTPGSYEAEFNSGTLSSGMYFYRIETDYFTDTKKMMLVK